MDTPPLREEVSDEDLSRILAQAISTGHFSPVVFLNCTNQNLGILMGLVQKELTARKGGNWKATPDPLLEQLAQEIRDENHIRGLCDSLRILRPELTEAQINIKKRVMYTGGRLKKETLLSTDSPA